MVATRQERRPGRCTQGGGVPLRVPEPVVGELLQCRHVDPPAKWGRCREPCVVVENDEDVGGTFRRLLQFERSPVGLRVTDVELDDALEVFGSHVALREQEFTRDSYRGW